MNDTLKKLVLLAEIMDYLAGDIEYEREPTEHGYIYPDGWTAIRTVDGLGGNSLLIKHRAWESNA